MIFVNFTFEFLKNQAVSCKALESANSIAAIPKRIISISIKENAIPRYAQALCGAGMQCNQK
jgi:hypothetical protein